jgi:hypothetical protein
MSHVYKQKQGAAVRAWERAGSAERPCAGQPAAAAAGAAAANNNAGETMLPTTWTMLCSRTMICLAVAVAAVANSSMQVRLKLLYLTE